jgi:polar amino acid transport system substrate-binding protein
LRASSTKIDAITAVLDGMAYPEFMLTIIKSCIYVCSEGGATQMIKVIYYSLTFLLLILSNSSVAENKLNLKSHDLPQVTFYTESYPPANYMENDKLVGISVESLKLMWANLGMSEQNVFLVPWARGYRNVLKTPNSALFTMSRTYAREHLFKWVGPLK